jgi:undecaprenyl-diphosphatase
MNQGILLLVHRIRPYDAGVTHLLIARSADPSFPSDHATLAFAVVFALLGAGARRAWGFLVAAVVLACSRVYVGTHYASDILGGALTGLIAAIICLALVKQDSRFTELASGPNPIRTDSNIRCWAADFTRSIGMSARPGAPRVRPEPIQFPPAT